MLAQCWAKLCLAVSGCQARDPGDDARSLVGCAGFNSGSLVDQAKSQVLWLQGLGVLELLLIIWWAGWEPRGPRANTGPRRVQLCPGAPGYRDLKVSELVFGLLVGGAGSQWLALEPQDSQAYCWCILGGVVSWVLSWTGLGPGAVEASGGLEVAGLLVGRAELSPHWC